MDLKQGIEYGYKVEVICGVNFPQSTTGDELFGDFVNTMYTVKSTAKDEVQRTVAKLILNSTYGRFAIKEQEYKIKFMKKSVADTIIKKHHYSYLSEI